MEKFFPRYRLVTIKRPVIARDCFKCAKHAAMQLVSNLTSRKLLLSLRDGSVAAEDTPTRVSLLIPRFVLRREYLFVIILRVFAQFF